MNDISNIRPVSARSLLRLALANVDMVAERGEGAPLNPQDMARLHGSVMALQALVDAQPADTFPIGTYAGTTGPSGLVWALGDIVQRRGLLPGDIAMIDMAHSILSQMVREGKL